MTAASGYLNFADIGWECLTWKYTLCTAQWMASYPSGLTGLQRNPVTDTAMMKTACRGMKAMQMMESGMTVPVGGKYCSSAKLSVSNKLSLHLLKVKYYTRIRSNIELLIRVLTLKIKKLSVYFAGPVALVNDQQTEVTELLDNDTETCVEFSQLSACSMKKVYVF